MKEKGNSTMLITIHMGLCGYGNEWEEDVEVTEEEYQRLKDALSTGEPFCDCEEVKDIYDRIVEIADETATDSIREYEDNELGDEFRNNRNLKASDKFCIWIECYEFEDEEEDL
jgi:hypothetical protein